MKLQNTRTEPWKTLIISNQKDKKGQLGKANEEGGNKENIIFQEPVEESVCLVKEQSIDSNTTNKDLKGFDLTVGLSNMGDTNIQ